MKLVTHAIAFGLGYALATQNGREQLRKLQEQATDLLARPEVKQLQDRAVTAAGESVQAVRTRLQNRGDSTPDPTPAPDIDDVAVTPGAAALGGGTAPAGPVRESTGTDFDPDLTDVGTKRP